MEDLRKAQREQGRFVYLLWLIYAVPLALLLLVFVPPTAFSYCSSDASIKSRAQAISAAIALVESENLGDFSELRSPSFLDQLRQEPNCCRAASRGFDWKYLTEVWDIEMKVVDRRPGIADRRPGHDVTFDVSVAITACRSLLERQTTRSN